jgi:hypothetical protein
LGRCQPLAPRDRAALVGRQAGGGLI